MDYTNIALSLMIPMAGGLFWLRGKIAEHDRAIHNFETEFTEIKQMLREITKHLLETKN